MTPSNKREALLRTIDEIIRDYAQEDPELFKDLQKLRTEAEDAIRTARWFDLANTALRVTTLLKFLFDHLPPPH